MSDRYTSWIRDQIKDHAPSEDHPAMMRLADACVSLGQGHGMVFGMSLPTGLGERAQLRDEAIAVLRQWVPRLGPGATAQLAELVTRTGLPIDLAAKQSEHEARRRAELDAQLARSLAVDARYDDLERAIADDLDAREPFLVLADYLQSKGDPRGELITLQLRGEDDARIWKAAHAHLRAHDATLIGPLAAHQRVHDDSDADAFTWRRGYIHRARLSCTDGDASVVDILDLLLRHPSGRFLAELVIGLDGDHDSGLADVVTSLAAHGAPALRMLHLGDFQYPDEVEMSWFEVGDLSPLWTAGVPRLAHLIVQGASIQLGAIAHPALARLEIRTGGLPAETARAIATMKCPRMAHLEVWYGDEGYGADASLADVEPLLVRTDLPALRHLGLRNCELTDEICGLLPQSPLLRQLEVLDLSMGTLSDEGAQTIAAYAHAFRHLKTIDISQSFVSDAALAALRAIGPRIVADDQRDDDDGHRYVSVGE